MSELKSIDYKDWFINQKRIPDKTSVEYKPFHDFHKDLCINGFMMDGVFINPFLYWHLNLWHTEVDVIDEKGRISQPYINPTLRDNEWIVTNEIEKAHIAKKGLVILGLRRMAKSVMEASYIGWGATFDENSQNVISGLNAPDIKLITDKLDKGLNYIPEYWRWQRIEDNWKNQVTLGIKTRGGERIPFSYILIRNLDEGNNEEAIAGTKPRKLIIDEIGKGSFLKGLQAAKPGFTTPFGWGCSPILTGTGGDMKKFQDAKLLMFDVEAFNFMSYNNADDTKRVHGLFLGHKYRMEAKEPSTLGAYLELPKSSPLHEIPMQVSNVEKADKVTDSDLEALKKSSERSTYLKEKMYYPKKVDDIFLNEDTNIFDIEGARRQQLKLYANGVTGTPVILFPTETGVGHEFTDKRPITNFPVKPGDDKDAPVVILEFPITNPPYGLYVAGCLLPGERVITEKGRTPVENVILSDKLINKDGEKVDIINLQRYFKQEEDIYTIKVSNSYRTTSFTKEHPIYVSDSFGNNAEPIIENRFNFDFVKAENLKINQWIKVPNIYKKKNEFDIDILWNNVDVRIDRQIPSPLKNENFWWFIGIFLGDGWCESNRHKISVSFNKKETLHIYRFTELVESLFNRKVSSRVRNNCIELTFCCDQLHNFIINHFGKSASGKRIPDWAKRIDNNNKYQLLLGYLDSDGCIYRDKKRNYYNLDFVSISLDLLEDIQDVLLSLGYVSNLCLLREAKVHKFKNRTSLTKPTYQLRVGNNETIKFSRYFNQCVSHKLLKIDYNNLKKTVTSPKSGCFISECGNYAYFKIKKINKFKYTGWVYNFECDTHTYMCRNITTHNCDPYRQGKAEYSKSLGTVAIYKRMHDITGEKYQDMFVAYYAARPNKKEDWEKQAELLIQMYNARTLCENDEISFIEHMKAVNKAHYLEKQPEWLKEIVPNTTVSREYGIHRSANKIIDFLHGCWKRYTEEVIFQEKDEQGNITKQVLGMSRVLDPMVLEETIQFNEDGNFDRLIAYELALALAYKMDPIYGRAGAEGDGRIKSLGRVKVEKPALFQDSRGLFIKKKRKLFT